MKTAKETAKAYMQVGVNKTTMPAGRMFLSAILAGAFIAFGALGSQIATACIGGSAGRLAGACVFPVGLILVVSLGTELFTGNCLLILPLFAGKIKAPAMIKNWCIVYLGNFVGSLLVALAAVFGHTFGIIAGAAGSYAPVIDTAVTKGNLSFGDAFLRGILCNVLVCLAVWLAMSATEAPGKFLGAFFPVMLFVLCGFEHSVANMYFLPAGALVSLMQTGASDVTVLSLLSNLLPVTIGNILGGGLVVGGSLYLLFAHGEEEKA